MSIARILHADIVCGTSGDAALVDALERSGLVQLVDAHANLPPEVAQLDIGAPVDISTCDAALARARGMLDAYNRFLPVKKGLMQGFFGSPPLVSEEEFQRISGGFDLEAASRTLEGAVREYDGILEAIALRRQLLESLAPWEGLDIPLEDLAGSAFADMVPVRIPRRQLAPLQGKIEEGEAASEVAWIEVSGDEKQAWGVYAAIGPSRERLGSWLREAGAEVLALPTTGGTPSALRSRAVSELEAVERRRAEIEEQLIAQAVANRPAVCALVDQHANTRKNLLAQSALFRTGHATTVTGWVLERNRTKLERFLSEGMPSAQVFLRPPEKSENPPVLLENARILKPFQSLLDMFGLPSYFGFDPTPVVAVAMTLFYAMCLGDVGYGGVQVLLAWALLRKFKPAEGTRLFLTMFIEMGVASMIFGLATWSFFGTSPGYTVGGAKILGLLPLFMPTSDFLLIIGLALAIGVVYQLTSVVAGLYGSIHAGDLPAAVFDYGAWLLLLVSAVVWTAGVALPSLPGAVRTAGLIGMGVGCLVIVAFAGRDAKTIFGRLLTGVISLYGIVGYYGLVSFFSDVLSFCRLAILNLTSGFIAMVGNLLGGLIISTSGVVMAIFTIGIGSVIILFFHVLNLVLSMQGSFIHSLRLNYLESFGRYYKTGGRPFLPLRKEGQYYRFEP